MKKLIYTKGYAINESIPARLGFQGKYVLIRLDEDYLILISNTGDFPNHADVVYQFMFDNDLLKITILGGGIFISQDENYSFKGRSSFYGKPTFSDFAKGLVNFESRISSLSLQMREESDLDNKAGETFDIAQITAHAGK